MSTTHASAATGTTAASATGGQSRPVLTARGLTRHFGPVAAVDGIDLDIAHGEVVAILGPNGAGKTTTIEMLLGLRRPTSGEVEVFGQLPDRAQVRARVGAMLQESDAPAALTVSELIGLVGRYYPYRLPVAEVLERGDLTAKRSARVGQLSGGQRQRLNFALAIAGDPDLLFLDEPTAALDVTARQDFWTQVRRFADLGKTVLFSTHNMAEAEQLAQRVIVIAAGRIVADGTVGDIKRRVSAVTIRLVTDASADWIAGLPGVQRVGLVDWQSAQEGAAEMTITVADPAAVLRPLFAAGYRADRLRVAEADLQAAFLAIVDDGRAPV